MPNPRFEPGPGEDPCSIFFKGFSNAVKADEISEYFVNKGYSNRIAYQKVYPQYFRLFMALRFETAEIAKEVCEKFADIVLFGYKIHLSFFKTHLARIGNDIQNKGFFMQDKVRKLRAQATRGPFFFRPKFNSYRYFSPGRQFPYRPRRRSRSSSSESDGSNSPNRKRRTRSRESSETKRRRHRSHSHSRSSRSTSRSQTPTRASPSSTVSKRSSSSVEGKNEKRQVHSSGRRLCSQVTVVVQKPKKAKDTSHSSKETASGHVTKESNTSVTGKQNLQTPSKGEQHSNFSPVSFGSDDEALLTAPTQERAAAGTCDTHMGTKITGSSRQSAGSYFTPRKTAPATEVWITSEGDSTPDGSTPSPRGQSLSPRGQKLTQKPNYGVYNRVGSYTEVKAANFPWQLKPLAVQSEGSKYFVNSSTLSKSPANQAGVVGIPSDGIAPANVQIVQTNNRADAIHVSPSNETRSQMHHGLTSNFGASPPEVNGVAHSDLQQTKLVKLQDKKEEIIKAYKQDCDTFATVVRMLIRKDPELETRLQAALHENLTEIGQRCIQELQEVMQQIKA